MMIDMSQDEIYKLRAMLCVFATRAILSNDSKSASEIHEVMRVIDCAYDDAVKRLDEIFVDDKLTVIDEINELDNEHD